MSVTFSTGFHVIKPGLRVSGDEISVVFVNTYDSGLYAGKKYIHIDLTNEPDLTFVEAGVNGPLETVADVDALYTQLKDAGMTEAFEGFLIDPSDLSSIGISNQQITFDFAGHSPYVFSRNADAAATERTKLANQTWSLPQPDFAGAVTLFSTIESPEELEFQSIEARLNLEAGQLDALIASGMWLFPDQASFPPAADNHGRVVHSHADGAMFYAHAGTWNKLESEAASNAADAALSGRLDVLELDPTTATALAAGDAATLSSATTYTDTAISNVIGSAPGILDTLGEIADSINDDNNVYTTLVSSIAAVQADVDGNEADSDAADAALSGRIDTLEADPTTATAVATVQADVNANETASDAADTALSGRLDTLEADPTTATAVAAVQSDVDQNESDADAAIAGEATTRGNADTALSGRLDVLEADPTTATAVAAVQADVNQNETDADAAIAAEATTRENADTALGGRLDVLEADPTTQTLLDAETAARIAGDDALRSELFPSPACEYQDIQATVSAGDFNTAQDGKLHYDAATKKLYIPNDLRKAGTPPNQTNVWPYGSGGAPLPPSGSIYINLVGNVVVYYANDSGVVYAQLTDDISALLDTEIVIRWCAPDSDLPYVLPEELDVEIARIDALQTAGVWYFADQAAFPAAADNHGRVVHSHADGAQYFSHDGAWIQMADESDIQALEDRMFPSPECPYESLTYEVSAGDQTTAQDGKFHFEAGANRLFIPNDIRKDGAVDIWPYGSNGSPMPPDGNFYIDGVANAAVTYANGGGTVYAKLTDDISHLIGTEITLRWCPADTNLPYALPEQVDLKADKNNPDFTGQVDIDTNARIEFASNLTKIHNVLRGTSIDIGNNIELKPAAAGGRVEITGDLVLDASDITNAANDTAAAAAGVIVGGVYRNGSQLMVRVS